MIDNIIISKDFSRIFCQQSYCLLYTSDKAFDIFNYGILGLVAICVLYPLYFIVIASFSDPVAINNGQVSFWPVGFNTTGYQKIFENVKIWRSYSNTIFYTVVGTCLLYTSSSFTTPYLMDGNNPQMMGISLYTQFNNGHYEKAAALSVIMFLFSVLSAIVYVRCV